MKFVCDDGALVVNLEKLEVAYCMHKLGFRGGTEHGLRLLTAAGEVNCWWCSEEIRDQIFSKIVKAATKANAP